MKINSQLILWIQCDYNTKSEKDNGGKGNSWLISQMKIEIVNKILKLSFCMLKGCA